MSGSSKKSGKGKGKEEAPSVVPELLRGDMPRELREFAYECAVRALEEKDSEKDQAAEIKKALEAKAEGLWHAVVGREFGASIASDTGHSVFFRIGPYCVLAFRTLDEEAHAMEAAADDEADADDFEDEEDDAGGGEGKEETE